MNKENLAYLRLEVIEVHPAMNTPFGPIGPQVECRAIGQDHKPISEKIYYVDPNELVLPGTGVEEINAVPQRKTAAKK